ncbi:MAG: hypothetical protein RR090_09150 [Niameybacter sp.]|uniref:hypothetical protein n=1 Tax=Niameybacter sp. TaxID=2033640 RepID=UPI002FC9A201
MWLFKRIKLRVSEMQKISKYIRVDCKFLIIAFFMCLLPICIASFAKGISDHGNMIIIRTMFSSLLGYIIENITNSDKNKKSDKCIGKTSTIGFDVNKDQEETKTSVVNKKSNGIGESTQDKTGPAEDPEINTIITELENNQEQMPELRILIIGHILLFITLILIAGILVQVDQNNQSLVLLKNTAFACVGFLISATKSNMNNK